MGGRYNRRRDRHPHTNAYQHPVQDAMSSPTCSAACACAELRQAAGAADLDDFERHDGHSPRGLGGGAFVNAVAELKENQARRQQDRLSFKDMRQQGSRVAPPARRRRSDGLSLQLMLLVDGADRAAFVRQDPTVAGCSAMTPACCWVGEWAACPARRRAQPRRGAHSRRRKRRAVRCTSSERQVG